MGKKHRKQASTSTLARSASQLLQEAQRELAKRRFSEVERLCRKALEVEPSSPEALELLGVAYFESGRRDKAIEALQQAVEAHPTRAEALTNLGVAYQMSGDNERALAIFERAVQADPNSPLPLVNRGFVLSLQGRHGEAVRSFQHALALDPRLADAHFHLGNSLRESGRREDAIASFRKAIELAPNFPDPYNNLGTLLLSAGRYEEAFTVLQRAAAISRSPAVPLANLATVLSLMGRYPEAKAHAERSIQLQPSLPLAHCALGRIVSEMGDGARAEVEFRRALSLSPDLVEARVSLANLLQQQGKREEGIHVLRDAPRHEPGLQVLEALALPIIVRDRDEISECRARFAASLERLCQEGLELRDPMNQVGQTTFYLAYHGLRDRELQELVARFYLSASPDLGWAAPHCGSPVARPSGRRIKVGVASAFLRSHTIGKLFGRLVGGLADERIETVFFQAPSKDDEVTQSVARSVGKTVRLSPELQAAREQIAAEHLDVLFYPEIGMDAFVYYLAYSRLAPVQCVTWGHPMTTGSPSMDYFISTEAMETPESDDDFTEQLVRLPDLTTVYTRPDTPAQPKSREAFGLPGDAKLYACPQTLFKFHPDFDDAIAELLRRDSKGLLVLIEGRHRNWDRLLIDRFQREHPDVVERIVFLPQMPLDEFLSLAMVSDAVLDPFHFGGGNSSMEMFAVGAPVVTLPGTMLRNRITLACYRKMGMLDLVAGDAGAYVDLCYRMANDRDFRQAMRHKTLDTCDVLFDNHAATAQLQEFFVQAVDAASRGQRLAGRRE